MVSGPDVHICNFCIEKAFEILEDELSQEKKKFKSQAGGLHLVKPADLKRHLDEFVIGQEEAKKVLSVPVSPTRMMFDFSIITSSYSRTLGCSSLL